MGDRWSDVSEGQIKKPVHDWNAHNMHPIKKEAYAVVRDDLDVKRIAELEEQLQIWIVAHKALSDRFFDFRQRTALYEMITVFSVVLATVFGFILLMNAIR